MTSRRYKLGAVIGTWTLCDCMERKCLRVPIAAKTKAKLPTPRVAERRRRVA